jgi:4-oxalocrotonate tautomerase
MPDIMVRLWPGKSDLPKRSSKDVMDVLNYGEESASVAIEEVKSQDWAEKVYKPDIRDKWDKLYKKPGYTM